MKLQIEQLQNNQVSVTQGNINVFYSYGTPIAIKDLKTNKITLDEYYWDYSHTTRKWLYCWLTGSLRNITKKDVLQRIKSGEYKLADLQNKY